MAFEVRIRQTGFFRKKLEIEDIASGLFIVGMHDRFLRFSPVIPSEGFLIVYDPKHIGTGIRMRYDPEETEEIKLSLPAYTGSYDIAMMITIAEGIMKKWQSEAAVFESVEYAREDLGRLADTLNEKTATCLAKARSNYTDDVTLVHGALWPLMIETEKLRQYGMNHDTEGFADLLHQYQNNDLYWCATHVYLHDDQKSYQGVLSITDGDSCIIPLKPAPPIDMIDPISGDALVCSSYIARIVEGSARRPLAQMEYHKFLDVIRAYRLPKYDACHVVYKADAQEIRKELEKREEMEGKPCW